MIMADSTENRGPQDRSRINMNQEHEVRYWTEKLGVSRDQLERAVQAVGPSAESVEKHLQQG
jgi:hypothetical protein